MSEIEFSAVNIGDMWGLLYNAMRDRHEWNYYIKGIYEQDNKKFAIVYDDVNKLYRLDFSLTEEGITLADEITEVKEEFIETDNMKKFAEPEDVEKYRLCEDCDDECDEDDKKAEMSETQMKEKIADLESKIEDKDNIIMQKDKDIEECNKELEKLRAFKKDIEDKQKAQDVEKILSDVKNYMTEEQLSTFRKEGLSCEMAELDSWSNKVKAFSFEVAKNVKSKKNEDGVWSFAAPVNTPKKNGLWD